MIDNYYEIENLSVCFTEQDIKKVFESVQFPNRGGSFFLIVKLI